MSRTAAAILCLVLLPAAAGCGSDARKFSIYLPARLGPDGPPGQRSPVLTPVEREPRAGLSPARQAALDVLVGPSPRERARGFRDAVRRTTRLVSVRVAGGTATAELAGDEPGFVGAAALVYSLTELPGVERVRLLHAGRPCCVFDQAGEPVSPLSRLIFRGWSGEPCALRTARDAVACRKG